MKKNSYARLRRTLAMIAALTILLAGLTACSKTGADTPDITPSTEATTPTTEAPAPTETTEAPTEATEPEIPTISGTVNTNNLNIRTSPSSTSAILGQLDAGDKVEIMEQQSVEGFNWGRIEQGWIRLDFVTIAGQETNVPEETTPTETAPSDISGTAVNKSGTVTANELNIRSGPDTTYDKVGKYVKGDKVTITITKDGWGKTDKGWVSMKYVTLDTTTSSSSSNKNESSSEKVSNGSTTVLGTVKITHEALNVRTGPGNTYDVVKYVTQGNSYSYYEKSGDWVRINDGWIYTKGYTDIGGGNTTGTSTGTTITGTVNATELNIRSGPDTSYESVGKYVNGDKVTITETKDGWGKTDKGWISMNYVKTN